VLGRACPRCGRALRAGGTYCPYCDAPPSGVLGATPPAQPAGPRAGSWALPPSTRDTAGGAAGRIAPTTTTRPFDRVALGRVFLASILAVASAVASILLTFALSAVATPVTFSLAGGGTSLPIPPFWVTLSLVVGGSAVALAETLAFYSAFRGLAYFDYRFSTPSKLAFLQLVGELVILFGAVVLMAFIYGAIQCAGAGHAVPSGCINLSTFWAGFALLGIGSIIALIGYIGVVVGVWRLGTRYRVRLFRIGALLMLIPYVSGLGSVLVAVAARRQLFRLGGAAGR